MAKVSAKLTENQKRKAAYAALASEGDKQSRNEALEAAIKEGAANIEAVGEVAVVERSEFNEDRGKTYKRKVKVRKSAELIAPKMPAANIASGARAAKRARLKAKRHKVVKTMSHPNGPCGNIGCAHCNFRPIKRSA